MDPHPTWSKIDSTKLKAYIGCPRRFFFEYILGWRPDDSEFDLNFGSAVHEAMEVVMLHRTVDAEPGYTEEVMDRAYQTFMKKYLEFYPDALFQDQHSKKNPERVRDMLNVYRETFQNDNFILIQKETHGAINIDLDSDRKVLYKMDGVIKDKGGLYFIDHKTSGWSEYLFRKSHELSIQMKTYKHVLDSIYGAEAIGGTINALLFGTPKRYNKDGALAKNSSEGSKAFRIPLSYTREMMLDWWYQVNRLVKEIEANIVMYLDRDVGNVEVQLSFEKRESYCLAFNRVCPYHDYCTSCANPARLAEEIEIPVGFHQRFWDPTEVEPGKEVVHYDVNHEE